MIRTDISGVIVSDDDLYVYEWLEMTATSPKKIKSALAKAKGEPVETPILRYKNVLASYTHLYQI